MEMFKRSPNLQRQSSEPGIATKLSRGELGHDFGGGHDETGSREGAWAWPPCPEWHGPLCGLCPKPFAAPCDLPLRSVAGKKELRRS